MGKIEKPLVLLMGPPNVGKSVIFNYLTGLNVSCANYPGTTVEYAFGTAVIGEMEITLVDVPGTYTLDAENDAEKIAVKMLSGTDDRDLKGTLCHKPQVRPSGSSLPAQQPEAILCVLDANNLESSLYLLLQILEFDLPVVAALNRTDLTQEKGQEIDTQYLAGKLGIPFIPTVAINKQGIEELKDTLAHLLMEKEQPSQLKKSDIIKGWPAAEELACTAIQKGTASQENQKMFLKRKKWGLLLVKPWPGIPLAVLILAVFFIFVIGLGMTLRQWVLLPIFRGVLIPQVVKVVEGITSPGLLQNILIGEYGFMVKGLEWPFTLVLPYVISFYTALTLLEDSGYMSRLGALLDGLLNHIGLHGSSIIPLLLGYGCAVPAIMSTRALGSRKERLIVSTIVCLAVPCIAQTGAFISLLAERSILLVLALFILSAIVLIGSGFIIDIFVKEPPLQTIMEIPELLFPQGKALGKKMWVRTKNFVTDGALPMVAAVAFASLLYEIGIMTELGNLLSPLVTGWLGMPQEAAVPLILGIFRRELTVLPLLEMELTLLQLFVGATVGLFYVPCIAVVATVAREFNIIFAAFILSVTCGLAFLAGGIIFRIGTFVLSVIV